MVASGWVRAISMAAVWTAGSTRPWRRGRNTSRPGVVADRAHPGRERREARRPIARHQPQRMLQHQRGADGVQRKLRGKRLRDRAHAAFSRARHRRFPARRSRRGPCRTVPPACRSDRAMLASSVTSSPSRARQAVTPAPRARAQRPRRRPMPPVAPTTNARSMPCPLPCRPRDLGPGTALAIHLGRNIPRGASDPAAGASGGDIRTKMKASAWIYRFSFADAPYYRAP